jgi:hypothetical protein
MPTLDELIRQAREAAASDEPIAQLSAAASLKAEVDDLTDAMLGHFVDQARRAGCSWSQIGTALGVSKQAAQQKHAPTMDFSRWTDRARTSIAEAQAASHRLGHTFVGTEHLLAGLAAIPEGIAGRIMADVDLDAAAVDAAIERLIGRGDPLAESTPVPFTPKAALALGATLEVALELGHNYIGTEHLLLALAKGEGSVARTILDEKELAHERILGQVLGILSGLTKPT